MQFIKLETIQVELKNGNTKEIDKLIISNLPVNALSNDVLTDLDKALDVLINKKSPLVIITGDGEKAFVAGANIAEMNDFNQKQAELLSTKGNTIFKKLESMDTISIACLNGFTLGGGLELALSTDIRIASEKAILGLPEVTLALVPGFGGTQRLSRLIGESRAKYYTLTGKTMNAQEAMLAGIVQTVCSADVLLNTCIDLAKTILSNGPTAVQIAKKLVHNSLDTSLDNGIQSEITNFSNLFNLAETKEGLTAFLEKRPAKF